MIPEQLDACAGIAEGMPCSGGGIDGTCRDGVCLASICGDGIASETEQCDGEDLKGVADCDDAGFYEGSTITCTPQCTFDVRDCARRCGDGNLDPEEQCEVDELGLIDGTPATCTGLGYYEEPGLACNPGLCTYDTSQCDGFCGDGMLNGSELCEGAPPEQTCVDLGFDRGRSTCSGLCGADTSGCDTIGWHRVPFTGVERLGAVFGTSATDINAIGWYFDVGTSGGPAWWHNDGTGWTKRPMAGLTPPPGGTAGGDYALQDATGWSDGKMISVGFFWGDTFVPMSIHYDGSTWTSRAVPTSALQLTGVWGVAHNDVYATAGRPANNSNGEVLHWNGTAWSTDRTAQQALLDVWGSGAHVYAVGKTGRMEHKNGTWQTVDVSSLTVEDLNAVWGSSPTDVFVVGNAGIILHYDGQNWEAMKSPVTNPLDAVWGLGPNNVFAGGSLGTILHYDGTAWSVMTNSSPVGILDIWGSSLSDLHAVGSQQILYFDGDGWERPAASPFTEAAYASVAAAGPDKLFVGARDIYLLDGDTWTSTNLPPMAYGGVQELFSFSATDAYAAAGELQHYNGTWTEITLPGGTGEADGVWGSAPDNVYVIGAAGGIWHHTGSNPLTTWTKEPTGVTNYLDGIWGSGPNDVFVVGDGVVLHRGSNGIWTEMQTGYVESLLSVHGTGPNNVFAAGFNGTILHYNGVAWTRMDSGLPGQIIFKVFAVAPDDVFAVSTFGRMIHYDGMEWTPVRTPTNAELNTLWSDGTTVYVAGLASTFLALERYAPW